MRPSTYWKSRFQVLFDCIEKNNMRESALIMDSFFTDLSNAADTADRFDQWVREISKKLAPDNESALDCLKKALKKNIFFGRDKNAKKQQWIQKIFEVLQAKKPLAYMDEVLSLFIQEWQDLFEEYIDYCDILFLDNSIGRQTLFNQLITLDRLIVLRACNGKLPGAGLTQFEKRIHSRLKAAEKEFDRIYNNIRAAEKKVAVKRMYYESFLGGYFLEELIKPITESRIDYLLNFPGVLIIPEILKKCKIEEKTSFLIDALCKPTANALYVMMSAIVEWVASGCPDYPCQKGILGVFDRLLWLLKSEEQVSSFAENLCRHVASNGKKFSCQQAEGIMIALSDCLRPEHFEKITRIFAELVDKCPVSMSAILVNELCEKKLCGGLFYSSRSILSLVKCDYRGANEFIDALMLLFKKCDGNDLVMRLASEISLKNGYYPLERKLYLEEKIKSGLIRANIPSTKMDIICRELDFSFDALTQTVTLNTPAPVDVAVESTEDDSDCEEEVLSPLDACEFLDELQKQCLERFKNMPKSDPVEFDPFGVSGNPNSLFAATVATAASADLQALSYRK